MGKEAIGQQVVSSVGHVMVMLLLWVIPEINGRELAPFPCMEAAVLGKGNSLTTTGTSALRLTFYTALFFPLFSLLSNCRLPGFPGMKCSDKTQSNNINTL